MNGPANRLVCPRNCGKTYTWKNNLHRHLKFECGVHPQFKCPYCSKLSHRKFNLKTHVLSVHKVLINDNLITVSNNVL